MFLLCNNSPERLFLVPLLLTSPTINKWQLIRTFPLKSLFVSGTLWRKNVLCLSLRTIFLSVRMGQFWGLSSRHYSSIFLLQPVKVMIKYLSLMYCCGPSIHKRHWRPTCFVLPQALSMSMYSLAIKMFVVSNGVARTWLVQITKCQNNMFFLPRKYPKVLYRWVIGFWSWFQYTIRKIFLGTFWIVM